MLTHVECVYSGPSFCKYTYVMCMQWILIMLAHDCNVDSVDPHYVNTHV